MKAIINAELVMRDHLIPEAVLFIEDGKIAGFGEMRTTPIPDGCEIIDAQGAYVGPGLVDIHCHAGDHVRFEFEPIRAAKANLARGTTSVLAATGDARSPKEYVEIINRIGDAMQQEDGKNLVGMYMEGPYMNPDFGSGRHNNPWHGIGILPEHYEPMLEAGADIIRVWALAPEREDVLPFVLAAKKANPAVRFTVGHSTASPQEIERLVPYGLCIGTHHTNATGDLPKYPECRGVCVDEAVNYNSAIYAEVISDSAGVHVDPYMQRLIRKIKGDDKIILVSDQTCCEDLNPEGFEHITDINFTPMPGGVDITGSKLYLHQACRNWMKHTGASIVEAFKLASYNPAKAVGLTDRGEILEGKKADLIFVDIKMNVKKVVKNGVIVKE
ncbi:MAG: amidohydrolase family protein [Oscillospiraceae bacterium]|nr:amidohydrolase family protein [Oscillospiraceae bacterium]